MRADGRASNGTGASNQLIQERREGLRHAVDHVAHLLPKQGPIGVFVHHNTLHAWEDLPFERAVIEAWQLFGAEPYMSEAAYRAELLRGRIHLRDIDAVLDSEADAVVFSRLSRRSLRRSMITPACGSLTPPPSCGGPSRATWRRIFARQH